MVLCDLFPPKCLASTFVVLAGKETGCWEYCCYSPGIPGILWSYHMPLLGLHCHWVFASCFLVLFWGAGVAIAARADSGWQLDATTTATLKVGLYNI